MAPDRKHPYRKLPLPANAPFQIRPSPGKGWGVFATKPIKKGSQVLAEKALFVIDGIFTIHNVDMSNAVKNAVNSLPRDQRKLLLSFHTDLGDSEMKEIISALPPPMRAYFSGSLPSFSSLPEDYQNWFSWDSFFRNNGIKASKYNMDGERASKKGLFPTASRLNYSCRPNCYIPVHDGDEVRICAIRDIAEGDELTIRHDGLIECLTKTQRHKRMLFKCICNLHRWP